MNNVPIVVTDVESGESVASALLSVNLILNDLPNARFFSGSGDYVIAVDLSHMGVDGQELAEHVTRALIIDNVLGKHDYEFYPNQEIEDSEAYDSDINLLCRDGNVLCFEVDEFPMYRFTVAYLAHIEEMMQHA